MTLTEEQRAALKRVAAYMDEMYAVASPYYGCTEDANILRAMIDSSGTVEPTGGFDLEAARAGIAHYRIENHSNVDTESAIKELVDQANLAEDAVAEIERLRADLEQSEEIKRLKDELENYGDHYACLLISKDAQIKELEGMLSIRTEELDIAHSVARSEKEMHEKELAAFARRIKELEGTLAEIRNLVPALIGPHGLAHYCAEQKVAKLVADDKIGPDAETGNRDHVVGPGQMIPNGKCWQITEERKAAIDRGLQFLEWSYAKNSAHDTKEQIAVLWAMLDEVGQCE